MASVALVPSVEATHFHRRPAVAHGVPVQQAAGAQAFPLIPTLQLIAGISGDINSILKEGTGKDLGFLRPTEVPADLAQKIRANTTALNKTSDNLKALDTLWQTGKARTTPTPKTPGSFRENRGLDSEDPFAVAPSAVTPPSLTGSVQTAMASWNKRYATARTKSAAAQREVAALEAELRQTQRMLNQLHVPKKMPKARDPK